MNVIVSIYLLIGMFYAILEHRTFEFDFTNLSKFEIFLNILQHSIHLLRTNLTWPLYLCEDFCIFMLTKREN